jgi:hypothetical protein
MNMHLAFIANDNSKSLLTSHSADGQVWSDRSHVKNPNQSQSSKTAAALAVFQDKLWIAFVAKDTNQLLVANSGNGQEWSNRIHVKNPNQSQSSKTAAALAVFQNKLWIAFLANSDTNQLLVSNSDNGQVWSDNILVKNPDQSQLSKTAPALAVFQDKLWIAFVANSDTNQLLVSNSDNGQVWSDNILVKNPDQRQLSKAAPALSVHA